MSARRSETTRGIDAHIGARLREIREARGFSQGRVAEALGLRSRQAVAAYEAGDAIAAAALFQLTQVLQVEPHAFFEGLAVGRPQLAEDTPRPSAQAARLVSLLERLPEAHQATVMKVVKALVDGLDEGA